MLERGQAVWSDLFGYGQVLIGGENPFVRWVEGPEGHVRADSVRRVPTAELDSHVAWQNQRERDSIVIFYGDEMLPTNWQPPTVRDEDGFWILASRRQEAVDRSRTISRPDLDDVDVYMDILDPDEIPDGATVIECAVTRLNGQSCRAPG